jgi:hypothetical protein
LLPLPLFPSTGIAMAEAVAAASPLMAAVNKIKDSTLHVISQVLTCACDAQNTTQECSPQKWSFEWAVGWVCWGEALPPLNFVVCAAASSSR